MMGVGVGAGRYCGVGVRAGCAAGIVLVTITREGVGTGLNCGVWANAGIAAATKATTNSRLFFINFKKKESG